MRILKLVVAYDGTAYVGWQRQENGLSIQECVEEALRPLAPRSDGTAPVVIGAGRTDSGVHALGQVASVSVGIDLAPDVVQRALNIRLPADIRVLDVADANIEFHARYQAVAKSYRYRVVTSEVMSPFDRLWAWHAPGRYDVEGMQSAAAGFEGRHDFASLQTSGSPVSDTFRTMHRVAVTARDDQIVIDVEGDGFLRHMVRAMVGTLVDVGMGRRSADSISSILTAGDRGASGRTVPARGLTLVSVRY